MWQVGEVLVVSTTSDSEPERCVVAARPASHVIDCVDPFKYTHDCFNYSSSKYGFSDTRICYEVGLLSRNVVIQGDDESASQQFGMHSIAAMGATMRVENAEWRNCGQSLIVGRYCMHFHLLSDESLSYARANSFHDGFQRAVTIHASNNLRITDNVAYHIMAHPFFIEDGVELGIVLEGNLVISVLSSPGPIRSDETAACFWSASGSNNWLNNVCSSAVMGYWLQVNNQPNTSHKQLYLTLTLTNGTFSTALIASHDPDLIPIP